MATTYKGLFLQLGMNNEGILSGLKEVDKELSGTKKELKELEKSLNIKHDSSKFVEAQKLAQRQVELTKQKVDLLKKGIAEIEEQGMGKVSDEFKQLQNELKKAEYAATKAESQLKRVNDIKFTALQNRLTNIKKNIDTLGDGFVSAGQKMTAVTTAVGAGMAYSANSAMDFQKSMAKVNTIIDPTKMSLEQISGKTIELSDNLNIAATEVGDATYQAVSAGVATEKASETVEKSGKAAVGGFTDITTAIDAGTSVINAYGRNVNDLSDVYDEFLMAQNFGKTTFGEIAQSIGNVVPLAAQLNVGSKELLATYATLTKNSVQTAQATSSLKAAFSNIITPSEKALEMAKKLGIKFNAAALQEKGLPKFLEEIKAKTNGNVETMGKLFGSTEALNSILVLTGKGANDFTTALGLMDNAAGSVDDAFKKVSSTDAFKAEQAFQQLKNSAILLGQSVMPMVGEVSTKIKDLSNWFRSLSDEQQRNIVKWAMLAASIGPALLVIGGIVKAAGAAVATYKALSVAINAYTVATNAGKTATQAFSAALATNQVGVAALAIGVLVSGIIAYVAATSDATGETSEMAKKADELSQKLDDVKTNYEQSIKQIDQSISSHKAEAATVDESVKRLEELAGKTKKTAEEKAEMARIVDNLNKIMPDLNLAINNETGALNMQIGTVWKAVEAWNALAYAKAVSGKVATERLKRDTLTKDKGDLLKSVDKGKLKKIGNVWGESRKWGGLDFLPDKYYQDNGFKGRSDFEDQVKIAQKLNSTYDRSLSEINKSNENIAYWENLSKDAWKKADSTQATFDKIKPTKSSGGSVSIGGSKSKSSGGKNRGNSKSSSTKSDDAHKKRVERYDQGIDDTETWNQNYYDKLKAEGNLSDAQELKSIEARRDRYKKYAIDLRNITYMSEDEKLKRFKDYSQKAEKLDQDAIKMKRDMQADAAKAWMDNVDETERWNKRHYDNRKKLDDLTEVQEIKSIEDRRDRYIKYSNDIMKIEGLTNEEKLKKQKEYREKAEDVEIELYEFKKSIQEREVQLAKDKLNEMLQLSQGRLQKELEATRKYLSEQERLELDNVNKQVEAQEKLLQTKISAIDEEIAARRRLREDEDQDGKIAKIQERIKRTEVQIDFARDAEAKEQLQRELMRQQTELKDALQNKEDTEYERQKQAEKDAINAEIERLREQAKYEQENISQKYADKIARQEAATARKEAEYTSRVDAQTAYATQAAKINNYNNSNTSVTNNATTNNPTVVINHTLPATYAANLINKILRG